MKSHETYPNSSNIQRISWTDLENGEDPILTVDFVSGQVWQYWPVPEDVYDDFAGAPSAGKFFHERIKGKYQEKRL